MQQSPIREKRYKDDTRDSAKGKQKFQKLRETEAITKVIIPKNKKQQEYLELLNDPDVSIIVATGYAGTSKTWMPTAWSCNQFLQNRLSKFVLSRPAISNSKSLGYFTRRPCC